MKKSKNRRVINKSLSSFDKISLLLSACLFFMFLFFVFYHHGDISSMPTKFSESMNERTESESSRKYFSNISDHHSYQPIKTTSIIKPILDRNQLSVVHAEMPAAFRDYNSFSVEHDSKGLPNITLSYHSNFIKPFKSHPYHHHISKQKKKKKNDLVDYMVYLSDLPQCSHKPIFVSMARVQDELYWQLIENFFHTMLIFGHLDCAILICIADTECMRRCKHKMFPCIDYGDKTRTTHIMELVAEVKLYHIGRALEAGVNVFLLDLDVGFLRNPLLLYEGFLENSLEQVRAQMDMGSHTEKFSNTAYSAPRPNFGLFIVKSHPYSVKAFKNAWKTYQKADNDSKKDVAIDQNNIVNSLKWARWRWTYNFSYFHLGFMLDTYPRPVIPLKTVLLDKMKLYSDNGLRNELGGEVAVQELKNAVAVHATCHEGSTKLLGLKASNSFWNYEYYNPKVKTITKPLMFTSRRSLKAELHALAYLAVKTKRMLIVPNVLIGVGSDVRGQLTVEECLDGEYKRGVYCRDRIDASNSLFINQNQNSTCMFNRGEIYWPAWRTITNELEHLKVLEPSFYYRIEKDFKYHVPDPFIFQFDVSNQISQADDSLLQQILLEISKISAARLVIDIRDAPFIGGPRDISAWARDSASAWGEEGKGIAKYRYRSLPVINKFDFPPDWEEKVGLCKAFAREVIGNRTCFDKCK